MDDKTPIFSAARAACLLLCAAASAPSPADETALGARLTDDLLGREYMHYGEHGLHYAEAATAVGALRWASLAGDAQRQAALVKRYRPLLDDESGLVSRRAHVDMSVIGIVPLEIALLTRDPAQRTQGLTFADRQWADPTPEGLTGETRWWVDDLYMVGMLQIQAYRATGDVQYADHAARQLAAYLPRLQQPNGLFHHGPDSPFFWGRGNGWVASAMAEVLHSLPADHELRPVIIEHHALMMKSLLAYQADSGMWRQLLDHPEAWPETSGTAMFAYAMLLGVSDGLLDAAIYEPAAERAWEALQGYLDEDARLREVCVGTGKEDNTEFYLERPRVTGDLHGQAPMLWLTALRLARATGQPYQ